VRAANGTDIIVLGEVLLPFELDGRLVKTFGLVTADIEEVMLGFDWLKEHECLGDFRNSRLYVDGHKAAMLAQKRSFVCRRVYVEGDVTLEPRQQMDVPARTTLQRPWERIKLKQAIAEVVDSTRIEPSLYVGRTLLPSNQHRNLCVRVINTTASPQTIINGTCLGRTHRVEVLEPAPTVSSVSHQPTACRTAGSTQVRNDRSDVLNTFMEKLPDDMTPEQREKVESLLTGYDDIFSRGAFDMGRTNLVKV